MSWASPLYRGEAFHFSQQMQSAAMPAVTGREHSMHEAQRASPAITRAAFRYGPFVTVPDEEFGKSEPKELRCHGCRAAQGEPVATIVLRCGWLGEV